MKAKPYFQHLKKIKWLYLEHYLGEILKRHPAPIDPYFYDWNTIFTPTEYNLWGYIRSLGLPFYPQFPLGNYFVGFADPSCQIAIEVEGTIHNYPFIKERDQRKYSEIEKDGWQLIIVKGKETFDPGYKEEFYECFNCYCPLVEPQEICPSCHKEVDWFYGENRPVYIQSDVFWQLTELSKAHLP